MNGSEKVDSKTAEEDKTAYILSSYPSLSQTFVLREMLELERNGFRLHIFALKRSSSPRVHPENAALRAQVDYLPELKLVQGSHFLWAHARCLLHRPIRYLRTFGNVAIKVDIIYWLNFLRAGWVAARLLKNGNSHMHAHSAAYEASVAMLASLLTGIPYSFTAHSYDVFAVQRFLTEKIQSAKFVATISDFNKTFLDTHFKDEMCPDKIHIIHYGLEQGGFTSLGAKRKYTQNRPFTILSIARLVEKKGLHFLIEALSRLHDKGRDFRCIIAGDGPERSVLERETRARGLADRVTFLGEVVSTEVLELLENADVFVLPCIRTRHDYIDGMPVVLMEAMAAGLPVVSTTISGIPELITDGVDGLLVEPEDSRGVANAIEYLLDHPETRERLGKAAPKKIAQEFDLKANVQKLGALFRN